MSFAVGETVVYPNHGAAVIEGVEVRQINGEDKTYLILRVVAGNGLVLRVPTCNLAIIGVRDVVDEDGLKQVLEVLRAEPPEEAANWSRRRRVNADKLRTGSVIRVAEVVRDLWRRERAGHLSAAERHTLAKARQILVSELDHCGQVKQGKAETLLNEALAC